MAGRRKQNVAEPTAYQRALGLLVRREHSRKELSHKLKAKGIEAEASEAALDTLLRQDFQSDQRFAEALARTRATSGYGPVRIRAELGTHDLASDIVDAALDVCETDWDASARALVIRRYSNKNLSDPVVRRKALDFLLRHGFEQKSAYAAVRMARTEDDFDSQD